MENSTYSESAKRVHVAPLEPGPSGPLCLDAPGSKSHSTRALVLQFLSGDCTQLSGCSSASDAVALSAALQCLRESQGLLNAADGGAPGRFLLATAAVAGAACTIDGSSRLRERPFGPLVDALRKLGCEVHCRRQEGLLPIEVSGRMTGSDVAIDSSQSSQFASALMLVGPMLPNGLLLTAQDPVSDGYLDLTVQVMEAFGAVISQESIGGHRIFRIANGMNPPSVYRVPQDVSGAAFLWLAGITGSVPIGVAVDRDGGHPDLAFLDCLEAMGADVSIADGVTTVGGDLRLGGSFDLSRFPDSACALGIAAAINPEPVTIHGAAHLRLKESDRIGVMVAGLRALGLDATARHDGFRVEGAIALRDGCVLPSHDDHRIAMAFATLGARHAITVDGAECVDKSFPEFFDVLRSVAKVKQVETQS